MQFEDVDAVFRPIDEWPGAETEDRTRSPFSAPWGATVDLLRREIGYIIKRGERPIIELGLPESKIRNDGYPYANANPDHPGVIVTIETDEGPLRFPCDTFDRMQDNFRAIALSLENLRRVDRYGVTKRAEQYRGFRALPPAGMSTVTMSKTEAAEIVARSAGVTGDPTTAQSRILTDSDAFERMYRLAAKYTHPDAGGVPGAFEKLQDARRRLLDHHAERGAA